MYIYHQHQLQITNIYKYILQTQYLFSHTTGFDFGYSFLKCCHENFSH